MQLSTEKVVLTVHSILELIKEVRAQVMMHEHEMIKLESKEQQKMTRDINYSEQKALSNKYQEAVRIEREASAALNGLGGMREMVGESQI